MAQFFHAVCLKIFMQHIGAIKIIDERENVKDKFIHTLSFFTRNNSNEENLFLAEVYDGEY